MLRNLDRLRADLRKTRGMKPARCALFHGIETFGPISLQQRGSCAAPPHGSYRLAQGVSHRQRYSAVVFQYRVRHFLEYLVQRNVALESATSDLLPSRFNYALRRFLQRHRHPPAPRWELIPGGNPCPAAPRAETIATQALDYRARRRFKETISLRKLRRTRKQLALILKRGQNETS